MSENKAVRHSTIVGFLKWTYYHHKDCPIFMCISMYQTRENVGSSDLLYHCSCARISGTFFTADSDILKKKHPNDAYDHLLLLGYLL